MCQGVFMLWAEQAPESNRSRVQAPAPAPGNCVPQTSHCSSLSPCLPIRRLGTGACCTFLRGLLQSQKEKVRAKKAVVTTLTKEATARGRSLGHGHWGMVWGMVAAFITESGPHSSGSFKERGMMRPRGPHLCPLPGSFLFFF